MKRKVVEKGKDSKRKRSYKLSKVIACTAVLLVAIAIAILSLAVVPVIAQEEKVTITVNAPEYVEKEQTFDVTIDVDSITDFNTGLFDLSFDRSVVEVSGVEDGSIDGTTIPVDMWKFTERDTITVFFTVPGASGVSGSGYLAKISFKVKGDEGDECELKIDEDNSLLANITAEEIPAEWIDAELKVGAGKEEEGDKPPDITAWEPTEAVVSSPEGESMTFEIEVDQEVDISWQINGSEVKTEEGKTESDFKKDADAGTWNVSVIATSTATGLSSMHTWIWPVMATSTETEAPKVTPTPTPTSAPGVTSKPSPTSTLAPGETAKPAAPSSSAEGKPKPTAKPTAPPEEGTPTPNPAVPGFEAIFAIAAVLAIAYVLRRRGGR